MDIRYQADLDELSGTRTELIHIYGTSWIAPAISMKSEQLYSDLMRYHKAVGYFSARESLSKYL